MWWWTQLISKDSFGGDIFDTISVYSSSPLQIFPSVPLWEIFGDALLINPTNYRQKVQIFCTDRLKNHKLFLRFKHKDESKKDF